MEKAKDGVTLIADAIRAETAQSEKEKTTNTETTSNVIDVTAQFNKRNPPAKNAESMPDVSDKMDISNDGNKDDGTM